MRSNVLSWFRGYVKLNIFRGNTEQMLNRMMQQKLEIWNIRRLDNGQLQFCVHISDFNRLRAMLKKTGCRLHVQKKAGLPFWLHRLGKRKWFAVGTAVFFITLYILSSLIWKVDIEAPEGIASETIAQAARQHGIHPMQWKYRLKDPEILSKQLMDSIPDSAWVGVDIQGTVVQIKVIARTIPEEPLLYNPRHLISAHDAVITKIIAEKGTPVVQRNTKVKKGDILISGLIGNEQNQKTVVAKGEVWGAVWYEYEVTVPLQHTVQRYTGDHFRRNYLVIGDRALQLWGFGKENFTYFQSELHQQRVAVKETRLPLGWLREEIKEVIPQKQLRTQAEARNLGVVQARADVKRTAGSRSTLLNEKVIAEEKRKDVLYLKIWFEVEQRIGKELAIMPEQRP